VGRGPVQWVSDLHLLRLLDNPFEELVVDHLFHEYSAGGDTVFSLVEEDAAERVLDGLLHVAVSEDDQGGFAPQL